MKIIGFGKTHTGIIRDNNEDNIYIDGKFVADISSISMSFEIDDNTATHTVAVFDGIGGAACGEYASLAAASALCKFEMKGMCDIPECIYYLNNSVLSESESRHANGMGATVALVHISDDKIKYANVGDSRIYSFNGVRLEQLSIDHTRNQVMKDAGINNENLLKQYEHQLTQNLGIPEEEFVIEPTIGGKSLYKDEIILLCSDGLTDVISNDELFGIIAENSCNEPKTIVEILLNFAFERKTKDNVSIIVLKVE